jgi:hypothetical protein
MLAKQFLVDARLVVEALGIPGADELHQVLVPDVVLRQHDQVIVRPRIRLPVLHPRLVEARAVRHIHLAADDRLHPLLLHGVVELDGPEHVAVVRDRARRHPELADPLGQILRPRGAVEE